jgi:D-alanyl-D-alanine carboxypeptidase (penicillin-binding protein 5/6)
MNYVYRFYESRVVVAAGQPLTSGRVWKGTREQVSAGLTQDLRLVLPRGAEQQVEKRAQLEPRLVAPLTRHATVGTLAVKLNGRELASRPLVALDAVEGAGLLGRLADDIRLLFE